MIERQDEETTATRTDADDERDDERAARAAAHERETATSDDDVDELPRVTITQMRHNVAAHKTESHRESMQALAERSRRHGYLDVEWAVIETETGKFDRLTGCKPPRG